MTLKDKFGGTLTSKFKGPHSNLTHIHHQIKKYMRTFKRNVY